MRTSSSSPPTRASSPASPAAVIGRGSGHPRRYRRPHRACRRCLRQDRDRVDAAERGVDVVVGVQVRPTGTDRELVLPRRAPEVSSSTPAPRSMVNSISDVPVGSTSAPGPNAPPARSRVSASIPSSPSIVIEIDRRGRRPGVARTASKHDGGPGHDERGLAVDGHRRAWPNLDCTSTTRPLQRFRIATAWPRVRARTAVRSCAPSSSPPMDVAVASRPAARPVNVCLGDFLCCSRTATFAGRHAGSRRGPGSTKTPV